jgi:hypothetical protein
MDVEVDLYSGRPNPHFRLNPDEASEVLRRLADLPPLSDHAAPREGLGYRGLRLVPESSDSIAEIEVSAGVVVVHNRDGSVVYLADPGRTLERWLIETGAESLGPDVTSVLRQEVPCP